MLGKNELKKAQGKAIMYLKKARIVITEEEKERLEVADFGLGDLKNFGLQLVVYVNTQRCCAKELILFPFQICPEHLHPPIDNSPGKEETFRCRWGRIFLYLPGEKKSQLHCKIPPGEEKFFTSWQEIVLNPGEQYTIPPNTLHWFQADKKGAIVSEFSTQSRDELDIFTNPKIKRTTEIKE